MYLLAPAVVHPERTQAHREQAQRRRLRDGVEGDVVHVARGVEFTSLRRSGLGRGLLDDLCQGREAEWLCENGRDLRRRRFP